MTRKKKEKSPGKLNLLPRTQVEGLSEETSFCWPLEKPLLNQRKRKRAMAKLNNGHTVEYFSPGGHTDQYKCSCGWISTGYWDAEEAAFDEWLLHAYDTGTEIRPVFAERQTRVVKDRDRRKR